MADEQAKKESEVKDTGLVNNSDHGKAGKENSTNSGNGGGNKPKGK